MITYITEKNVFNLDFIPGVAVGIEFFVGDDAAEDDLFAMTIDIVIIRLTYVRRK